MTGQMRWDHARQHTRQQRDIVRPRRIIPVNADTLFWEGWRHDSARMRRDGYRVRKVGDKWQVWIEEVKLGAGSG